MPHFVSCPRRFSTPYSNGCTLKLSNILAAGDLGGSGLFFDLFLQQGANDFYPIPIRVRRKYPEM